MAKKNKPKITQTKTTSGHIATIEEKSTPYLLVPAKFLVRIYCQKEASKVLHVKRTSCMKSAQDIVHTWAPP